MTQPTAQDNSGPAPDDLRRPGPWRRRRWLTLAALIIVALLIWRWAAHRAPPPVLPPPPVAVVSTVVTSADLPRYVMGIGTVQATTSVTVRARVDGQIERVAFAEGRDVKAGDLLVQIDARPYRAQLEQARATKARDVAQLVNARLDLRRYQTLAAQGASPQQQADTQAALVKQLEAAVLTDQAQIDYAAVQLDYTTIRSPIDGRTGVRLVDVGNIVHAADASGIVIVNQIDPITVLFTLPEDTVGAVNAAMQAAGNAGLAVDAFARNGGERLASGKLTLINNQIDNASGTVQLKATFANASHRLWPGQYVNARLTLGVMPRAVALDASVVQNGPGGTFVYVVNEQGKAAVQPVKVGVTQGTQAIIESGLTAGTRVVVDGQLKLRPGTPVTEARNASGRSSGGPPAMTRDGGAMPPPASSAGSPFGASGRAGR
ncbi:efflux RND transporter periplasmic adaptor subunit [Pandoraea bronchicola]|uniref:Efflux RND transporter periplasmic adaptor subunit n=1 Tax=Pandoraea bronchicola TaxID=2508287 RepID=A0A5E5BPX9_9BURK|nr:efflux RND transporter periplasmic adaptor subunit [Pandoraea bronchicola]VVE87724.1 efflux RND transporter periplasmic adaptor subunit [Pandoraea bronchicola]